MIGEVERWRSGELCTLSKGEGGGRGIARGRRADCTGVRERERKGKRARGGSGEMAGGWRRVGADQ